MNLFGYLSRQSLVQCAVIWLLSMPCATPVLSGEAMPSQLDAMASQPTDTAPAIDLMAIENSLTSCKDNLTACQDESRILQETLLQMEQMAIQCEGQRALTGEALQQMEQNAIQCRNEQLSLQETLQGMENRAAACERQHLQTRGMLRRIEEEAAQYKSQQEYLRKTCGNVIQNNWRCEQERDALQMTLAEQQRLHTETAIQLDTQLKQMTLRQETLEKENSTLQKLFDEYRSNSEEGANQLLTRFLSLSQQYRLLEENYTRLQAYVPPQDGGTADAMDTRRKADLAFQTYQRLSVIPKRSEAQEEEFQNARRDMLQAQALLARIINALALHTVQKSETLSNIAKDYYGQSSRWREIFQANAHLLESPNQLIEGVVLLVP